MCYYSGPQAALYEKLGHAEVVQVQLDSSKSQQEMERFADVSVPCLTCSKSSHSVVLSAIEWKVSYYFQTK